MAYLFTARQRRVCSCCFSDDSDFESKTFSAAMSPAHLKTSTTTNARSSAPCARSCTGNNGLFTYVQRPTLPRGGEGVQPLADGDSSPVGQLAYYVVWAHALAQADETGRVCRAAGLGSQAGRGTTLELDRTARGGGELTEALFLRAWQCLRRGSRCTAAAAVAAAAVAAESAGMAPMASSCCRTLHSRTPAVATAC